MDNNLAAEIVSEVLTTLVGSGTAADATKSMIKQLFLSGAKQSDLESGLLKIKAVIDKHAPEIEAMKKPCNDCEKEKKALVATKSVFD